MRNYRVEYGGGVYPKKKQVLNYHIKPSDLKLKTNSKVKIYWCFHGCSGLRRVCPPECPASALNYLKFCREHPLFYASSSHLLRRVLLR